MNQLNEILDKLNFLMSQTYLMVDGKVVTAMDLYNEVKKVEQLVKEVNRPSDELLREYAHKSGRYRVANDGLIVVDYNGVEYSITR